jgi:hypothetical protein
MNSIEKSIRRGVRKALHEQEDLSDVDAEEGKMHDLLGVPQDQDISDEYDSGEQLARDLVDATEDEKEASGMIAYAANINSEENIFDDALDAIGEIDFEESKNESVVREAIREAISEILTEDDDYQSFVKDVMGMLNVDDPQDFTEEGRKKFFNFIDTKYDEDSDEAEEVTKDELASEFGADHFKNDAPDFVKKKEEVSRVAKKAARKIVNELR